MVENTLVATTEALWRAYVAAARLIVRNVGRSVPDPEVYCDLAMGDLGKISLRDSMCN